MCAAVDLMTPSSDEKLQSLVQTMETCSQIMMKDVNAVAEKVFRMKFDGLNKLQAVIDFDRTISSYCDLQGNICPTSYWTFMQYCKKNEALAKIDEDLRKKYLPIEFDHSIPTEKKIPLMLQWWYEANKAIIDVQESKDSVLYSTNKSGIYLREGFDQILKCFNQQNVPVCVGSAGLGDVVKCTVEKFCGVLENISYASNFFQYDENDIIVGFSQPMIHSNNKFVIAQCDIPFDKERRNIVLIGDSIGDCSMVDDLHAENVLKIGFFNSHNESEVDNYLNYFDIVIESGYSAKAVFPLVSFLLDIGCC